MTKYYIKISYQNSSIKEKLSKNSSNEEMLNKLKTDQEKAVKVFVKDICFQSTKLEYEKTAEKQTKNRG